MPEFMFRNLSVKLFPAEDDRTACADATTVVDCSPFQTQCGCTNLCTGTFSCRQLCSATPSQMIACDPTSRSPTIQGPHTELVFRADAASSREELAALKRDLRAQLADVEAMEQSLEDAGKPSTVDEIDGLKEQLLAAVAELDEHRARLTGAPSEE
jgi:hypothetical protein